MSTATLLPPAQAMPTEPEPLADPTPAGRAVLHRIVLTGFMGSGKSTAGALLAERLGWRLLDLDREIERRHNRSVPQIFDESGEAHFRHLESAALASLLGQRNVVIALGGGTPEELGNRLLLEQTPRTAVVYLAAPFSTLLDRCTRQASLPNAITRPVLADVPSAELRFHLRHPLYLRIAGHTLDTSNLTPSQTPAAILALLHQS